MYPLFVINVLGVPVVGPLCLISYFIPVIEAPVVSLIASIPTVNAGVLFTIMRTSTTSYKSDPSVINSIARYSFASPFTSPPIILPSLSYLNVNVDSGIATNPNAGVSFVITYVFSIYSCSSSAL